MPASASQSANQSANHPSSLTPGDLLQGRYRIVRHLGKGGMGAVYEAVDQRLDVPVALKETFSVDCRLRRQFEQEARLLAQLNHPALPRVSDYFTEDDRAFLVMQFISGIDLASIINKQRVPFPPNQVIAWADQLLDALIYLHTRERQIIHRDIKPHNLKLTPNGQIALLDFGLAKMHVTDISTTTASTSIFGYTRRYSPLEQMQDEGTTAQSDIYALGATLYHLLTGQKPPDALARAAALRDSKPDPLKPAVQVNGRVGGELSEILTRAMALHPEDRFASAADFREALRQTGRIKISETDTGAALKVARSGLSKKEKAASHARPDPFDSYSILRPAEMSWLMPTQPRRWGMSFFILTILILTAVGAVSYGENWISTGRSVLSDAGTKSIKGATDASSPPPTNSRDKSAKGLETNRNSLKPGPSIRPGVRRKSHRQSHL